MHCAPFLLTMQIIFASVSYRRVVADLRFYRKQDGSTFVFEKLAENLSITPLLFTEDYIVSKLNFDDYTCLRPFLSEQDYSKLLLREEDDNPCLVKFYFRKGGKNPGRM